jgi:sulfide:quinone oxidoreductase
MDDRQPFCVLIAGGGCAALEAAFRLQRVAEDRVQTTILTPEAELATHALAVLVPFAAGHVPREPLARLAREAGARLRRGSLKSVDSEAHRVVTDEGEVIGYDALLVAVGAGSEPAYSRVCTWTPELDQDVFGGLLADLEEGYAKRVAFVVPDGADGRVARYLAAHERFRVAAAG